MGYVVPAYTRGDVIRAGKMLASETSGQADLAWATEVLTNWRAAHGYPLNTFQATLREKLKTMDRNAVVGQRLKRAPSVIAKLQRFKTMKLPQMQDIAGLRAIVESPPKVRRLHASYLSSRFAHCLVNEKDYTLEPKDDGYRSVHLVYEYESKKAPQYDGLHVELQLRSKLQHAWATAVETVDAFLGESIKAGKPTKKWAHFFCAASASFAHMERSPLPRTYAGATVGDVHGHLLELERELDVLVKLAGFTVAADRISADGAPASAYHLVVLNTSVRRLTITSFAASDQERANQEYAAVEERARNGERLDPVLITGGSVKSLRKAYPNYFLDTQSFVRHIGSIINARKHST